MRADILDQINQLREEIAVCKDLNDKHENHSPHYGEGANREYRARQRRLVELQKTLTILLAKHFEGGLNCLKSDDA